MIGRDVGGAYASSLATRKRIRSRRRLLFAANLCINGSIDGSPSKRSGRVHGPVVPGTGKCQSCRDAAH